MIELWQTRIDYKAALYEIQLNNCYPLAIKSIENENNYWGIRSKDGSWKVDPI